MKPKRQFDETIAFWPRGAYNGEHGFDAVTNRRNAGCIAEKECKSRGFALAAKRMRKDLRDKWRENLMKKSLLALMLAIALVSLTACGSKVK